MNVIDGQMRSIEILAEEYTRSARERASPVSLQMAIRSIRASSPNLNYSDRELTDIIANIAVRHGLPIDFDNEVARTVQA